jgi:predicted RNA binding protein YcfA (HicA-like mRNA interferase family)
MTRLPRATSSEVLSKLKRAGFAVVASKGSHFRLRNAAGRTTTVPHHAGKILKPKTFATILQQAGLTIDEFNDL